MAPGGASELALPMSNGSTAGQESALGADRGYTAVQQSGSPRGRSLEPGSGRFGPAAMPCGQKVCVGLITFFLVCLMMGLGGLLGVQLGKQALRRSSPPPDRPAPAQADPESEKRAIDRAAGLFGTTITTTTTRHTTTTTTRQDDSGRPTMTPAAGREPERHPKTTTRPTTSSITTTTTTRTSTTRTSTTTTETSTTTTYFPTLFCYSIMRTHGYELGLVRTQLSRGVSIFACDAWRVYSDKKVWLTPGPPVRIDTTLLNVSLEAKAGVKEHILNTEQFLQAWRQAKEEGLTQSHEWSVKVDPDAVFFPARLQTRLSLAVKAPGASLYFLNCKLGFELYGALEVFSKIAMETFFNGIGRCKTELPWTTYGEDLFMRRCLDLLGVTHVRDYRMLSDEYCAVKPFPCVGESAAFHPFKASETYFKCVGEAEEADKRRRELLA
mmetsp:Transcript_27450/g.81823  ORF Transcript_27450/g.81823 Transcript_27450/m.81823 type:complete len:440 (-) Transcript_27450:41-1360(-)